MIARLKTSIVSQPQALKVGMLCTCTAYTLSLVTGWGWNQSLDTRQTRNQQVYPRCPRLTDRCSVVMFVQPPLAAKFCYLYHPFT